MFGVFALDLFGDLAFWGDLIWWLLLAAVAWWLYKWTQEHVGFSPMLTLVVAGILIWYFVVEYPVAGIGLFGLSVLLFSGVLMMLPILILPFGGLFRKH